MSVAKNTPISLNEVEQRLVKTTAKQRYDNCRAAGKPKCFIGYTDGYHCDIIGMGGELAFCKLFNVYPDLSTETPEFDTGDCVLDGLRIDVKTTDRPEGHLLATKWKKVSSCDAYALMTGVFPNYHFRGFMDADELLREIRLRDFGRNTLSYAASQDELKETII